MPQDTASSLNPALKIGPQFVESLRRHNHLSRETARARAVEWLTRVDIPEPAVAMSRHPHQFSGGQQQRIALALALCLEPAVLILDEPTTGLDVVTQAQVNQLITTLAREVGVATLYVSHNLALLATVCDRLAIMYAGQIVEMGVAADVYADPRHPYTAALIGAVPSVHSDAPPRGIPGIPRSAVAHDECCFLARCPLAVAACGTSIPMTTVEGGRQVRCIRSSDTVGVAALSVVAERAPEPDAASVLSVEHLTCGYRSRRGEGPTVVDDVSFAVAAGRTLGIAGESGSGKSTVLKAIVGLLRPLGGRIDYRGAGLPALAGDRDAGLRHAIQIVFQNPDATLNPRHTIGQSLDRPLRLFAPGMPAARRRAAVLDMMGQVRLSPELVDRYPSNLSGGQRQRVAIARALLAEPEVLLCDEVTSALDVSVQASILELLIRLRDSRHLALVFVTHDLGVLRSIADEAIVMQNGRIVEFGPVRSLLSDPRHPYTQRLIAAVPHPGGRGAPVASR